MNIPLLFRFLLVFSVVISLAGEIYPMLGLHETSEDLETILMWEGYQGILPFHEDDEWGVTPIIGVVIALLVLIAFIIGLIGAFLFKKWGRTLLAVSTLIGIFFTPFMGLMVGLPIEMFLHEVSGGAFFIALAMAFLSPLKEKFENIPNQNAAPVATNP